MNYLTITQLADALDVHRVTVYRMVKSGKIKAFMAGNLYVINDDEVQRILNGKLTRKDKDEIRKIVKRVIREYGETLRLLGND